MPAYSAALKTTIYPADIQTQSALPRHVLTTTPSLDFKTPEEARNSIKAHFLSTFDVYESLFQCLKNSDAYYIKPIALRHPLIFYFGHTATFFVNKLLLSKLIPARLHPQFESMFAVGVDEMSWDDLNAQHYDWPSVEAVQHYRDQVRQTVLKVIEHAPLTLPIDWQNQWWSILMGIEHERIHLETSSVLIRQHDLQYVQPHSDWKTQLESTAAPNNTLKAVPAGEVQFNKTQHAHSYYGWDNEYGQHQADVAAFAASEFLVSNQEFLAFVDADGYACQEYWSTEGWAWREFSQANYPSFWRKQEHGWQLRLMLEEIAMPWDWPVEVNHLEAQAFCRWQSEQLGKTIRLPTEDEWYRLYAISNLDATQAQPSHANIGLQHYSHACPVQQFKHGDFYDVQGNVWQWTDTPIYPFEGFQVHPIYDDFTTPTFDQKHFLMKGGSWISSGNESLYSARYAFRAHFFQHAGFRYIHAESQTDMIPSQYETDQAVAQYLEFQYGDQYFNVPNFAEALVQWAQPYFAKNARLHALDLGCATGRASFELARYFDQVTGLDFSARFIQQAAALAQGETVRYTLTTEGDLFDYKACHLKDFALEGVTHKVRFSQADACNLKAQFRGYDFILAANLIDRLHHPKDFLSEIHQRLNVGGLLMLSSPYTWLEEHTAKIEWLGGFKQAGESLTTFDALQDLLSTHFELVTAPQDIPFVIRETARKYQHTLSQVSLWRRIA